MATMKHAVVLCGFAVAAALGPVVLAAPAQAKNCPPGTTQTRFEGVCVKGASGGNAVVAPAAGGGPQISQLPGQLPTVNGVPCTPEHYGTCYGMAQQP
ncbi:hypothetical protein MMAG44476_03037 [Mycolicibacterium mageritense DSM 44476 = CIP 104973]|uniref:Intersectin-EH binding protein Ibp1 n=2 Tax=Mycolicibacterium mageritense TaxID=53462 RepID=A0AAI8TXJ0_MYCME|nr:hypothetical protein [Mycolicibacterium mageritense]MBN3453701.1 hypothetical protein [Mycobacterium sp. DSM 3803]MCC9185254.1 hypothetical protein [Mycolicibacterium mageritense]TXI52358.1 MAG: hypothetical protein E6Q55_37160 [Mycolicibacterium mageritense]CDO24126.1 hypothetical protein BN978_04619 [Mycolicibacterium mageritense DSM 44476 = CIP 104973]BDY30839.1 hypothetical protein hbim_04788 [Mycolicibacterium mageritense]